MKDLLKKYFGFSEFRSGQEEIIQNVIQKQDTLVVMPTGAGKSLCYQLPALFFDGITLVVSPLISLMKDQVDALKLNGISAAFINSSLSFQQISSIQEDVREGKIKILYIAPERLSQGDFLNFLSQIPLSLIAIDEAHCISQWGHDFRPDYRNLRMFREKFSDVPIIALTATATHQVRDDIIQELHLRNPKKCISSFDRKNLNFLIRRKQNTYEKLLSLLEKYKGESVIIYCFSRKDTENIVLNLQHDGINALAYHAGLDDQVRKENQEKFIKDEVDVMVATIAFGMGIDKPDVRLVVHYSFPKNLEGYYQEVGRAGRDGLSSDCVLFYSYGDKMKHDFFIKDMPEGQQKQNTIGKLQNVIDFCELRGCRRKFLLAYFDEKYEEEDCGGCDFCLEKKEVFDATEITQKILSCILRTKNRFGMAYIIDVLRGSRKKQILANKHDDLTVFGIAADWDVFALREIMKSLLERNIISRTEGQYPTLFVTEEGVRFLKNRETLSLERPHLLEEGFEKRKKTPEDLEYNTDLFQKLRILRKELAEKNNIPPYMVFSDVALQQMSFYYPCSDDEFLKISGVGQKKLEEFGSVFLEHIKGFVQENNLMSIEVPGGVRVRKSKFSKVREKDSTYVATKHLVEEKLSLDEIAKKRGVTKGTIETHIEKLIRSGEKLDISYLKPQEEMFEIIKEAFDHCGVERLSPVFEYLHEKYSYDDIKLVRLFLLK